MGSVSVQLTERIASLSESHPWIPLSSFSGVDLNCERSDACSLIASDGRALGSGILDTRDPVAAWRRFSWSEDAQFDEAYIANAIHDAVMRRGEESCRRLVSSDADYLPGLVIEQYEDLFTVQFSSRAVEGHSKFVVDLLKEMFAAQEIVLINDMPERESLGLERYRRTVSGNNLKGRWVAIDGVEFRIDLLNANKPVIFLDQREQHTLVGSLCEGRRVLDGFAHSSAFALQAMRSGAELAVAADSNELYAKSIGATAQKNGVEVEALHADIDLVLDRCDPGAFDAIIFDPPADYSANADALTRLHRKAFSILDAGGLLATYCRNPELGAVEFDHIVAEAAAAAGREGRIFARISQPFDFPVLLNLPESRYLKGLILQVE